MLNGMLRTYDKWPSHPPCAGGRRTVSIVAEDSQCVQPKQYTECMLNQHSIRQ